MKVALLNYYQISSWDDLLIEGKVIRGDGDDRQVHNIAVACTFYFDRRQHIFQAQNDRGKRKYECRQCPAEFCFVPAAGMENMWRLKSIPDRHTCRDPVDNIMATKSMALIAQSRALVQLLATHPETTFAPARDYLRQEHGIDISQMDRTNFRSLKKEIQQVLREGLIGVPFEQHNVETQTLPEAPPQDSESVPSIMVECSVSGLSHPSFWEWIGRGSIMSVASHRSVGSYMSAGNDSTKPSDAMSVVEKSFGSGSDEQLVMELSFLKRNEEDRQENSLTLLEDGSKSASSYMSGNGTTRQSSNTMSGVAALTRMDSGSKSASSSYYMSGGDGTTWLVEESPAEWGNFSPTPASSPLDFLKRVVSEIQYEWEFIPQEEEEFARNPTSIIQKTMRIMNDVRDLEVQILACRALGSLSESSVEKQGIVWSERGLDNVLAALDIFEDYRNPLYQEEGIRALAGLVTGTDATTLERRTTFIVMAKFVRYVLNSSSLAMDKKTSTAIWEHLLRMILPSTSDEDTRKEERTAFHHACTKQDVEWNNMVRKMLTFCDNVKRFERSMGYRPLPLILVPVDTVLSKM